MTAQTQTEPKQTDDVANQASSAPSLTSNPADGDSPVAIPSTPPVKADGSEVTGSESLAVESTASQESSPQQTTQPSTPVASQVGAGQQAPPSSQPSADTLGANDTLADILASSGAINEDQAKQIKLAEVQSGKTQEDIILSQNVVDETELTKAKAKLYNVDYLDLSSVPTSPEALAKLPQQVAQRFRAFPVAIEENSLKLAMADPLDLTAIDFIEQRTGMRVKPYASEPSRIETLISTAYSTLVCVAAANVLLDLIK